MAYLDTSRNLPSSLRSRKLRVKTILHLRVLTRHKHALLSPVDSKKLGIRSYLHLVNWLALFNIPNLYGSVRVACCKEVNVSRTPSEGIEPGFFWILSFLWLQDLRAAHLRHVPKSDSAVESGRSQAPSRREPEFLDLCGMCDLSLELQASLAEVVNRDRSILHLKQQLRCLVVAEIPELRDSLRRDLHQLF